METLTLKSSIIDYTLSDVIKPLYFSTRIFNFIFTTLKRLQIL